MKILVTGGAGFIGSHLCEKLLEKNHDVICLDNFNDYYDPEIKEENIKGILDNRNFYLIREDILNKNILREILSEGIDCIVHLAAIAGVRASIADPQKYVDIDIKGTLNLLEVAGEHKIKQFIFASSSSVYGTNQKVPFSEDDPVNNQASPYATAKRSAELYCKTYNHLYKLPITILRFFTVYGPRQRPDMAIHKFTRLILEDNPIPMFGDGTSERDYTYIDDCIDGILGAIDNPFNYEIFNLGNSETIDLKSLIELISEKLGVKTEIKKLPDQPGDVPITYADISKARNLLGYSPSTSLEEGVERFIDWYRSTFSN